MMDIQKEYMIDMHGIRKVFFPGKSNEVRALDNTDFSVESGEMVAVMGPSGSGKSTLLHIIAMLDRPTDGSYIFDGTDTSLIRESEMARLRGGRIGIVLQDYGMIQELTALENVEIPLIIAKEKRAAIRRKSLHALEQVGLLEKAQVKASLLSGGEQQRVAIARVIAGDVKLILADEPTGALDSRTTEEIMGILKGLNTKGVTIVVATHNSYVADCCSRRLRIKDGRLFEERIES